MYTAAKENDANLAICAFERIDLDINKVTSTEMTNFGRCIKEIYYKDDFVTFINPASWNKAYRRELIKDLRFLPFRSFNDTMLLMESFTRIKKITFILDVLYYYLRGDSQIHTGLFINCWSEKK